MTLSQTRIGRYSGEDGSVDKSKLGEVTTITINFIIERVYELISADEDNFVERLLELKGKTLGCFCTHNDCYIDVIVYMLNNMNDGNFLDFNTVYDHFV